MRERTIKLVGILLVLAMFVSMSTVTFAAKKNVKKAAAKSYGVKVPSSIINGSDITANRSFKNLGVKETSLAGINLGDSNKRVLQKYGNPTRVIVHSAPAPTNNMMGTPGMGMAPNAGLQPGMGMPGAMNPGMPGAMNPGMPGAMNPGMPGAMNPGMPGAMNPGMPGAMNPGMPGAMNPGMPGQMPQSSMPSAMPNVNRPGANGPGMPGAPTAPTAPGMPGAPGAPGMPGMPGMGGAAVAVTPDFLGTSERIASTSICWQYDLSSGVKLEFIIKDGRVSQITVLSLYPWHLAKLKCGLMIGDTYKLATYLWGVNYKQQQVGSFSRCTYWDTKGTALIFLNKKLVGMTVAAGEAII